MSTQVAEKVVSKKVKDNPVVWVDPNKLVQADFNPSSRTEVSRISNLIETMREHGFLPYYPILIAKDGRVGDGHRRLAAALHVGLDRVAVMYTDMSVDEIYALNMTHARHTPAQWLEAYLSGYKEIPVAVMRHITLLEEAVGTDYLRVISLAGYSPTVYRTAQYVANYTGYSNDVDFIGRTVEWLVEYKQQFAVRTLVRTGEDPRVIASAIIANKPLVDTKH